jgi:PP-loop superfamily ATP-utilizing enzyme
MQIHVFDTHVMTVSGEYIHFDVLVDNENIKQVELYAERYLASLGVKIDNIKQSRCNFCHSELANLEVQESVASQGYSIMRL